MCSLCKVIEASCRLFFQGCGSSSHQATSLQETILVIAAAEEASLTLNDLTTLPLVSVTVNLLSL